MFAPIEKTKDTKGKNRPRVLVGIPTLLNLHVENALRLLHWSRSTRFALDVYVTVNQIPHDVARNTIHRYFCENPDFDWIFMLDAMCVPPADVIERFLDYDLPMVGACAQTFQRSGEGPPSLVPVSYNWDEERDGYYVHYGKGLEEVDVTTCASTLVRRDVMLAVDRPAFQHHLEGPYGLKGMGEDFHFCENVRRQGFKIHTDYDVLCRHFLWTDSHLVNDCLNAELEARMSDGRD